MKAEIQELAKKFKDASPDDWLDKRVTAAGLGLLVSLLDTKAIKGGGPPFRKDRAARVYKKAEAIVWAEQYKAEKKGRLFTVFDKGSKIPWNPNVSKLYR